MVFFRLFSNSQQMTPFRFSEVFGSERVFSEPKGSSFAILTLCDFFPERNFLKRIFFQNFGVSDVSSSETFDFGFQEPLWLFLAPYDE